MIDDYLQMNAPTNLNLESRNSKGQLSVSCYFVSDHAFQNLTAQTLVISLSADVDACGSSGWTNKFTAVLAAPWNA